MLKYGDPAAICHGNPGGWQFSYRYATILLPWMFLLLAGNGLQRPGEVVLNRSFSVCRFGSDQRNGYVAIPVGRSD